MVAEQGDLQALPVAIERAVRAVQLQALRGANMRAHLGIGRGQIGSAVGVQIQPTQLARKAAKRGQSGVAQTRIGVKACLNLIALQS